MQQLNLPSSAFRTKVTENDRLIFDTVRKKFVVLTPEEWVRQHVVAFLLSRKRIPPQLLNVEKELVVAGKKKRYDIVVYRRDGSVYLIVECKAPKVRITQETFDQIARYNHTLRAQYLMVSNGMQHYYCTMDYTKKSYDFMEDLPVYHL